MQRWGTRTALGLLGLIAGSSFAGLARGQATASAIGPFVARYCVDCHNGEDKVAGLDLDLDAPIDLERASDTWEKVLRRTNARQMPPDGSPRPSEVEYDAIVAGLAGALDRRAVDHPSPGRTGTLRRLNRTEYQNAVRDLLALDVDAATLLPVDESSRGFDNLTVGDLSPTLLDRSITAAQVIARLAVGTPRRAPGGDTFRVPADRTQEEHVEGLPIGTRGGGLFPYTFPVDGDFDIVLRLARDRNEHVEGLREPHELEVLVDRERVALLTINPPRTEGDNQTVDAHLKVRVHAKAGPHQVGVTFPKKPSSLIETRRQPYQAHYNMHRHPRLSPALFQVSITGPYGPQSHGDTPSRRRLFVSEPRGQGDEEACARRILETLTRRAYRRPSTEADIPPPPRVLPRGTPHRRLRPGHRDGPGGRPGEPQVPLPDRARPARPGPRDPLPPDRPPGRHPPFVLPLEQHPRRRIARPRARTEAAASTASAAGSQRETAVMQKGGIRVLRSRLEGFGKIVGSRAEPTEQQ